MSLCTCKTFFIQFISVVQRNQKEQKRKHKMNWSVAFSVLHEYRRQHRFKAEFFLHKHRVQLCIGLGEKWEKRSQKDGKKTRMQHGTSHTIRRMRFSRTENMLFIFRCFNDDRSILVCLHVRHDVFRNVFIMPLKTEAKADKKFAL